MGPHGHAHPAIVVIVLDPVAVEAWIRVHAEPVGAFARAIAYLRQRAALPPEERALFDTDFSTVLRRAAAQTQGSPGS